MILPTLRASAIAAALVFASHGAHTQCVSKIGVVMPLTGPIAPVAQGMLKSAELAAEQVNTAGGANGCPVQLVVRDSQGQPSVATDAARQLIDLEGVRVIVGDALSGTTLAVLNSVTAPAGVPLISPTASSPSFSAIGEKTGLFFRLNISDSLQGIAAANDAMQEKSGTVAILAINNDWGQNLSKLFSESYAKLGGKIGKVVLYQPDQASYRSEVTSLIDSKPDALYFIGYVTEGSRIIRDWISQGGPQKLLFAHSLNDAKFVAAVGPKFLAESAWLTPGETGSDSLRNFRSEFRAKYNEAAEGPGRANMYDSIVLAALATQAAKSSTDPKAITAGIRKVTDPAGEKVHAGATGVKNALEAAATGKALDYIGAVGPLEFDKSGDIVGAFVVWKLDSEGKLSIQRRLEVKDIANLRGKLMGK